MNKILTLALAALPLTLAFGQALPPARPGQPAMQATDASWRCAQAHVRQAALRPSTTVPHRREMDKYDVKYYKLDLALENNSRNVAGSVWMRVRVGRQILSSLAFELYQPLSAGADGMLIDSVVVNGRRSPAIQRAGPDATAQLVQPAAAGSLLDARIYYHGVAPHGNSSAIGNALDSQYQGTYGTNVTWSLSEPFSAHEWFPCKQVLTDKADSSDVWVTTTLPNKAGSNGVLVRTVPLPGNKVRYEWKSRHAIDYYLISVAVAPYLEYVNYANPVGGPRIPIVNYVYNQTALTNYQTEIDRTPGFIENYSRLFGLYPFANEKYGHCMAPIGGGMEHQTMTTQDGFDFSLTSHELCHQWFGDNVTCATWEDISLNESFASYGEFLTLQAFTSPNNTPTNWLNDARYRATHQYTGSWVDRPGGSVRVPDTTNVGRIFNYALTYRKGALVVHMLRYLLNDDVKFFRALRTYQATFGNSTARIADLQRIFEAEAGRSLTYFFQQWYSGEGYPTFAVRWNQIGNQLTLRNAETVSMPSVTPFFDTDLDYRITFANGSTRTVRLRQNQATAAYNVAVAGTVASIALDPDLWVLSNTNLTGGSTVVRDATLQPLANAARVALPAVAVYPVPCREALTLEALPASAVLADVRDALGRPVARQPLTATRPVLDTHALAPGLYLLRLTDAHGQVLGQARFVRE